MKGRFQHTRWPYPIKRGRPSLDTIHVKNRDTGRKLPPHSPFIKRFLANLAPKPFKQGPEISLIALGDIDTYLVVGQRVFAGIALAPAKELIFQANMARQDPPLPMAAAFD